MPQAGKSNMQELLFFTQALSTAISGGFLTDEEAKKLLKDYLDLNIGFKTDEENTTAASVTASVSKVSSV